MHVLTQFFFETDRQYAHGKFIDEYFVTNTHVYGMQITKKVVEYIHMQVERRRRRKKKGSPAAWQKLLAQLAHRG